MVVVSRKKKEKKRANGRKVTQNLIFPNPQRLTRTVGGDDQNSQTLIYHIVLVITQKLLPPGSWTQFTAVINFYTCGFWQAFY